MAAETARDLDGGQAAAACELPLEMDPQFLLSLRFGPNIDEAVQRQITQYIRRVLHANDTHMPDTPDGPRRKRRRRDDMYASERYSGSEPDPDDVFGRKRKLGRAAPADTEARDNSGAGQDCGPAARDERGPMGSVQSIAFYSTAAGFDLDATRVDTRDTVRFVHGTTAIIGLTNESAQALGNPCFNCSMPGHEVRDCPMPVDSARMEANRAAFQEKSSGQFGGRFYLAAEDEKRVCAMRQRFRPGQPLSQGLRRALDLEAEDDVPEYIESMYFHGYPPAYLGSSADQDPMHAQGLPAQDVPQTPDLRVYSNADDYGQANGANGTSDSKNENDAEQQATLETKAGASDEEGAISDGEVDADGTQPSSDASPEPVRNIPLVQYPGLDLREFDFSSAERPGQPLRSHTPYRRPRADYYRGAYTDGYRSSAHNAAHRDGYYSETRRSRHSNRDGGFYSRFQNRSPAPYLSNNANGDSWNGMLEGYYRSATRDYAASDRYGEYTIRQDHYSRERDRDYPGQRDTDYSSGYDETPMPPKSPLAISHPQQRIDQKQQPVEQAAKDAPNGQTRQDASDNGSDDGELEDGECDMVLSE